GRRSVRNPPPPPIFMKGMTAREQRSAPTYFTLKSCSKSSSMTGTKRSPRSALCCERWPIPSGGRDQTATRFAADSPLEGDGFEPSVPVARGPVYIAEGELR